MLNLEASISATERLPPVRRAFVSHQSRVATRCGHEIHPSASKHTPSCSNCIASLSKAKLDAAQKDLVAEGGLAPPDYMRDKMWNRARLKHDITKARVERARRENQLRWERERAWDEAHKRRDFLDPKDLGIDCPVCASLVLSYPTEVPKKDIAQNLAWWELPGALVVEHAPVPRTPVRTRRRQAREPTHTVEASKSLRKIIENLRISMFVADANRRMWEERDKTELVIRRKYGLDDDFRIDAAFWDSPISGLMSLRNFQQIRDAERSAERRARGCTPRPTPPRSSLSRSELSEESDVDESWMKMMREKEEQEELEREASKVAKEVGYMYFVGGIDGWLEWREDILQSNRQLVVRILVPNSETSGSENNDDDGQGYFDENDENDDEVGFDEMEIDGP